MNVYDFDKTITYKDSSFLFIKYCFRHYPRIMISFLPELLSCKSNTEIKEKLFKILCYIPDVESFVKLYWDNNMKNIKQWYIDRKRDDDLIISAGPEFIIKEAALRLNFRYIATPMDQYSGCIKGKNCHDAEKLFQIKKLYPGCIIDEFYSDSESDCYLASIAKKAYLVRNDRIKEWSIK